ncbi:MAG: FabA/FabZ family ACP-dehydratase [Polyangiales bacterium]
MRPGFVVTDFTVDGDRCACEAVAPADSPFFDGHFPGDPVLPGVAQLSALAEPAARRAWPQLGPLRRANNLKFHKISRPGEALSLRCERAGLTVRFTLSAGEARVSSGSLEFAGVAS